MRENSSNAARSLHGDHLGSMRLATNASGTVVSSQEFDPWGQLRSGGISQTDINDTGQRLDDTGLLSYHAQMDDPALARFVSADSIVPGFADGGGGGPATIGRVAELSIRALTVDFHETDLIDRLNEENRFTRDEGFWFQLSNEAKHEAKQLWGPQSPQVLNRYAYVFNNPLRYTDPSGHLAWVLLPAAAAVLIGAAYIAVQPNSSGARDLQRLIEDALNGLHGALDRLVQFAKDKFKGGSPRPDLPYPACNLPTCGSHPYVPPKQKGNPEVVRAPHGRGYIERRGNIWEWDEGGHGGSHWDVQYPMEALPPYQCWNRWGSYTWQG